MCDHRGHAERAKSGDDLAEGQRPLPIRRLDQEILRIAPEPEAAQLVVREAVELFERDLTPGQELELDALPLQRGPQLPDAALHRIGRRRVVLANVRSRRNGDDPVGDGCARNLQRVVEIGGPVVEPREDVRVEIDQATEASLDCAQASLFARVYLADRTGCLSPI